MLFCGWAIAKHLIDDDASFSFTHSPSLTQNIMNTTFAKFDSATSLENYLVEQALESYKGVFGTEGGYYYPVRAFSGAVDNIVLAETAATDQATFSETNTQVDGVDEADFIETDGQFIYHVNGQLLTILDARQPQNLDIATQVSLSGNAYKASSSDDINLAIDAFYPINSNSWINGMYLQGDRLTVIASGWSTINADTALSTYYYYPGTSEVQVTVFNVANPEKISVLESTTLEGSLVTSRAIDDEVFVVTSSNFQLPGPLKLEDSSEAGSGSGELIDIYSGSTGTYETEEQYLERIKDQILELALPNVETTDANGQSVVSGLLTPPTDVYQPLIDDPWQQLTTVSTFDISDGNLGVDAATSIPTGWVEETFVSKDYMYLLRTNYQGRNTKTEILKYDLNTASLVAEGTVPGYIDDQFSVDEHKGFLRISTTKGFGDKSTNNVYVLEQNQSSLDIVGKVEDLAPGERIFSTRFQGDYGFVVTFRQVDPLFTLDLSNPKDPKVLGELKIPGFSEYLQVIPDGKRTLLLGVGQDADPETGQSENLKVSLFDVTNLENPTEIDNYIFEGDFTSSEALWDHLAITYSPEHKLLAIPADSYNYAEYSSKSALHVFEIDGTDGITSLGKVTHGDEWIYRSLYIDDTLFSVSGQEISAHQIPTIEKLDTIKWSGKGEGEPIFVPGNDLPFFGTIQDEVITGSASRDVINGKRGYDRLMGRKGRDLIRGNRGDDELYGGKNDDRLKGGQGADTLRGGQGDDSLKGGKGKDNLNGGSGNDRLHGGADADILAGGGGSDRFIFKRAVHSLLKAYDTILDLNINKDKIKGRYKVSAEDLNQLGSVDDLQPNTIRSLLDSSTFVAKGAATFNFGDETFLALNDKADGFQAKSDAIIKITGYIGNLDNLNIF
ncbi:MAG: beta-propeller domain-containing protein [Cyanobacteria bacterium P01_F01_bin.150]